MATFVNDTFTDTNGTALQSHTGETGATWTKHPLFTTDASISSNQLVQNALGTVVYYASGSPASADYSVQMDVTTDASIASLWTGVAGRMSTSANTYYQFRLRSSGFQLGKYVAGTWTQIAAYAATTTSNTFTLKLEMIGTAIKGYVDGIERCSGTDSSITAAGKAGVRIGLTASLGDATHDNFSAFDPVSGGTISSVDSPVLDAETGNAFTTTNYAEDVDDVTIQDVGTGNYEVDVSASLAGTAGSFTYDMPDISGYTADTLGTVFDSASHTHTLTAVKGAESDTETIVINPQAGYAVVEIASAVKTEGSVFEGWTGTPADGDQVYYPTADTTSVSATGILTTDKTAGTTTMFYYDTTDYKWKPFNINFSAPGAGGANSPGGGGGFISSCGKLGRR